MNRRRLAPTAPVGGLLVVALALAGASQAAGECVRFDGIRHCPVGSARLHLPPDGSSLLISNLGSSGEDGVASRFEGVTHWQARVQEVGEEPGDRFSLQAISNGFVTSEAALRLAQNGAIVVDTLFTGSAGEGTYSVAVINNGLLVEQFDGVDADANFSVLPGPDDGPWTGPFPWPPDWPDDWPDWPDDDTFDRDVFGRCIWGLSFDSPVVVTVNGAQAAGDEIRIIENLSGAGHYPYAGFDAIVIRANGSGLAITEEAVSTP